MRRLRSRLGLVLLAGGIWIAIALAITAWIGIAFFTGSSLGGMGIRILLSRFGRPSLGIRFSTTY